MGRAPRPAGAGRVIGKHDMTRNPLFLIFAGLPFAFLILKALLWERYGIFDFHTFHLAGTLANAGETDILYDPARFVARYRAHYGAAEELPWFYPPLLLPWVQFLALFAPRAAYLVNGFLGLGLCYFALWRFYRPHHRALILLSVLPLSIPLAFGHPTPLLLAFILLAMARPPSEIFRPLALLTLAAAKPHIGGVILFAFFLRRWPQSLLPALLIALAVIGGLGLAYGFGIWEDFLGGMRTAGAYLQGAHFNREWIASFHALMQALGLPGPLALAAHFLMLAAIVAFLAHRYRENPEARFWIPATAAAFFTSPYIMLYDTPFLLAVLAAAFRFTKGAGEIDSRWFRIVLLVEILPLVLLGQPLALNLNFLAALLLLAAFLLAAEKRAGAKDAGLPG